MNESDSTQDDPFAAVDRVCDEFEKAWNVTDSGDAPSIEEYLAKGEPAIKTKLLKELLLVEWEIKEKQGQEIKLNEYLDRFTGEESTVKEALQQRDRSEGAPKSIAHYKILRPLGAGGMGEVFLAEDGRLGRQVALKLLPVEWAEDSKRRHRFLTEARAASSLNHPNVCIIHEVGETESGRPYLIMEFLEGMTLEKKIRASNLTLTQAIDIGIQIADALKGAFARAVVHRDLKPANISLGDHGLVKVLDFGLAKFTEAQTPLRSDESTHEETQSGQILGTPKYMSPEQASGKVVDHRSDLFSLGIVIYELLTGRQPFVATSAAEIIQSIINKQPEAIARFNYDVPAEFERIVRKLLEKDVSRRYQSPSDLLVDLKNLQRDSENTVSAMASAGPVTGGPVIGSPGGSDESIPGQTAFAEVIPEGDVLLNFAPVDDHPLYGGRQGWVSQLHRHLSVRVEQLSGEAVKIAKHTGYTGDDDSDLELQKQLKKVKAMVSVVSPPFVKREGCVKEVQEFCENVERSEGLWVGE